MIDKWTKLRIVANLKDVKLQLFHIWAERNEYFKVS